MKSTLAKTGEIEPKWILVDASGKVLGRLAVEIANLIRGRHRATYTPHTDTGDYVVVINAEKVAVTGKKEDQKSYMFYNGYVGRERHQSLAEFRVKHPEFIIMHAVKGMLPKNRLGRAQLTKLKVYAGTEHPHAAQNPAPLGK